jgi:uncharacterized membrane protein
MKLRVGQIFRGLSGPERYVILVLLVLGTLGAFTVPLSGGYDEETHFIRAWEMAHYYFIPNDKLATKLPFPAIYWELSYRRQPIVQAVEPDFSSQYASLSLDAHDYIYTNVETRSVYSPFLLLPQALILRLLGLSLRLPALTVYYACRLAGLISYLFLAWLAVRLIPFGKWVFAVLITAPMALFQASTISADTISNGIGFLFIGGSLAIIGREKIRWREWVLLAALIALLFLAKVNLIFLAPLPFLLVPPSKFEMKRGYLLLAVLAFILLLIEVGGWNVLAYSRYTHALAGASPTQQLRSILSAPLQFILIILHDLQVNFVGYLRGWLGVYGYDYWPVPVFTYLLYTIALLASLWPSPTEPQPAKKTRIILLGAFVVGFLLTIVSLYLAITPVGSAVVEGVQGRYFVPVFPLLFLALVGISIPSQVRLPRALPIVCALGGLALFMIGLMLSYHVTCGSEYYRLDLCYQPLYKNWAPESYSSPSLSNGFTLAQEIVPVCNGMTQLQFWVNSTGTVPSGTTEVTLRDTLLNSNLAQQSFSNTQIPRDGMLTINFSPDWHSINKLFLLQIVGISADGIQLGYSQKPDYPKGRLYENNVPVEHDILFEYGCIAGLQKLSLGIK